MLYLLLGLVLFLGAHSVRIVAEGWRSRTIARLGTNGWKGLYSVISIMGFVLIVWGYGQARMQAMPLWSPPMGMRHLAALLMLLSLVLLVATYVPRNSLKARLHHPMVLSVKVWALAHLLSNGSSADVLLFGSFLVWAIFDFRACRQRDRANHTPYAPGTTAGTLVTLVVGAVVWAAIAFWVHAWLIGVAPLGR
jgi:uncharacterized membrane protein